jgi:hypothetical protein
MKINMKNKKIVIKLVAPYSLKRNNIMKKRSITVFVLFLSLFIAATTVANEPPSKKFSPVGTWEFSAPSAPEGYNASDLIITKEKKEYQVVFALSEYYKITATDVEYKKKSLSFTLYIENETVYITGSFEDDKFTGTASYSQGEIDVYATRKNEGE